LRLCGFLREAASGTIPFLLSFSGMGRYHSVQIASHFRGRRRPVLFSLRNFILALVLLVPASSLAAPVPPPPDKKQIAEWIKDLGARQFTRRDRAQQKLWEAGELAEEALREAVKSEDKEVKRRAEEILGKFKWGIYPRTPKKVIELIEQYQSGDRPAKLAVIPKFFEEGGPGCSALLKIVEAEEAGDLRREVLQVVSREAGRAIPLMAAEQKYGTLETLLELTVSSDRDANLPHYVAFHLLRGSLDQRIAHFKKLVEDSKNPEKLFETLFFLHRANGNVEAALAAAEKARRPELAVAILEEHGRWKELAGKDWPMEDRQAIERLGYRAAYHRLAGNKKELDSAIADIRKSTENNKEETIDNWYAAKALFLNDRPVEALPLVTRGYHLIHRIEILLMQMNYKEALELIDKARTDGGIPADHLNVIQARTLWFLGKKDEAGKLFAALDEKLKKARLGEDFSWFETLVETEKRLGMKEQAFEHCARALLVTPPSPFGQTRLLKKVLNGQEETAQAWWSVLRKKQSSEEATVTMKSLRKLLGGDIKGKELFTLANDMDAMAKEVRPNERERYVQAVGEVALKAGQLDLAQIYFEEKALSPAPLVKWGDHLAEKKKWAEAASVYGKGWEKDRRQPLALYLQGHALLLAGQKTDGKALMEQSHWLPLGDDHLRVDFLRNLAMRGHHEDSKRERELLLKTCPTSSFQAGEAQRLAGIDAFRDGKYLESARWHELAMLRCLRTYVQFIEAGAYVGVPHFIHRLRARGLIEAGKIDEAQADIDFCLTAMPGNIELSIQLSAALEKQGRNKEADRLFERMRIYKQKLLKDYPESAGLHNSLAWLEACCRRDLKEALEHAEKAVKLEPTLAGHRDTLAEVLFQLGKKEEAIGHMKKCIEMEPRREYYKKQLRRFEAGDAKVAVPAEE
jgi:tetratricopeptide (TPR) repeat protein